MLFLFIGLCVVAHADPPGRWEVAQGERFKIARCQAPSGTVSIVREKEAGIWFRLTFALPAESLDALGRRAPILRVDEREAADFQEAAAMGPKYVAIRGREISLLVRGGDRTVDPSSLFGDLLTGRSLTIRYFLYGGESKDVTLSLEGASSAIRQALSLPDR